MNREIIDKYFNNQTTPVETQKVLDWFNTPEGQQYLQERIEIDSGFMDRKELRKMVPELDSGKMFHTIHGRVKKRRISFRRKPNALGHALKAAAAVLVILTASFFYFSQTGEVEEQVTELEPVIFQTGDEQQSNITLRDGSVVRLNSNSEIIISHDFLEGTREVTLAGEAYFDIEHDPSQPFIIHANQSSVEVLGTAFNVRSITGEENVQVAVVEGRVSFKNASQDTEQLAVILSKGQYGYMDISDRTILVEDMAVENYLAWKSGRLIFDGLTLQQICNQMKRLYNIHCTFRDDEIKDLQLTANFSDDSLEKTLSVISLSLNINYMLDENRVNWLQENEIDTELKSRNERQH